MTLHKWEYFNAEGEPVDGPLDGVTRRLPVPGGWLYDLAPGSPSREIHFIKEPMWPWAAPGDGIDPTLTGGPGS